MVSIAQQKFDREINQFSKNLQKMEKMGGDIAGGTLWKYSNLFVASLVAGTRPTGHKGRNAYATGIGAVRRDIRRAYVHPSRVWSEVQQRSNTETANYFWGIYRNGTRGEVDDFLRRMGIGKTKAIDWDGGSRHRGGRNARGRYTRANGALVMQDYRVLRYSEEVQGRVMWGKAGWISDYRPPGGVKGTFPPSVKKHTSSPGRVIDKTKRPVAKRSIIFENNVGYIRGIFREGAAKGGIKRAAKAAEKDMANAIVKAGIRQFSTSAGGAGNISRALQSAAGMANFST